MRAVPLIFALIVSTVVMGEPVTAAPIDHLPALSGDYFPVASRSTGTTYHIYVRLPLDYAE